MSDSTSAPVECPICGEEFDPTAAGGWCTNAECGEWQYIGEEVPEPAETPPADDADDAVGEETDEEPGAEASIDDETEPTPDVSRTEASDVEESSDVDDESEPEATDRGDESEPAETTESADEPAEAADEPAAEESAPGEAEGTCPDCGATVDPDDNFCSNCGADLEAVGESALEACPSCGTDVDEDDSFCANCGEDLEAARGAGVDAEADDRPAAADEPAAAEPGGDESAADDEVAADDEATAGPRSLVLRARGKEIAVTDDDTVGREVRRLVTETGGDEDEAIRIHREHVRFVREDGRFYVVDLGDNPTAINGQQLSKGDREPIEPGDELELSGVVTLSVDRP